MRPAPHGSAPKHVKQLVEENHLRWDSLGEFLALGASFDDMGAKTGNRGAKILGQTLDTAIGRLLADNKSPSRKTGELDNRGSQFFLAKYWAQELAAQTEDAALAEHFAAVANGLEKNQDVILDELTVVQGKAVDIGGYYAPDHDLTAAVMRPSPTLNAVIVNRTDRTDLCPPAEREIPDQHARRRRGFPTRPMLTRCACENSPGKAMTR